MPGTILSVLFLLDYFKHQSPWVLAERNAAARGKIRVRMVIGDRDFTLALNRDFDRSAFAFLLRPFLLLAGSGGPP